MISPEILRRFPFFFGFNDAQLKSLAMIAEQVEVGENLVIFEEGQPADKFYILIDGSIDLFVKSEEEFAPSTRRDFSVGEINPGEVFGIGSVLEPYKYGVMARTSLACSLIEIDASALKSQFAPDAGFMALFMTHIANALMQRLYSTRIQLAAAWA
jgi:CRP-like cAMP-binding protein